MSRKSVVTCDWCEDQITVVDDEVMADHDWIEVSLRPETFEAEPIFLEFCSTECVVSYFQ